MAHVLELMGLDAGFIKNIGCAFFLGSLIGLERQWRQRRAGLRTNVLVAVGSSLFVMATDAVGNTGDHARIAAQVVSGIGFLGAGLIMREGTSVRGLNTAATLWGTAAIGVLCGYGLNGRAVFGAMVLLSTNILLRPIVRRINRNPVQLFREHRYCIEIECRPEDEDKVRYRILQSVAIGDLVLKKIESVSVAEKAQVRIVASIVSPEKANALLEQVVGRLSIEPGINLASWNFIGSEVSPLDD